MKKCINVLMSVSLLIPSLLFAQKDDITKSAKMIQDVKDIVEDSVKHWNIGGLVSASFTQSSFINWASGGQNSLGLTTLASVHANYKKQKVSWLNDLELGYGFQEIGAQRPQKTTDQIEATSSVGYKIFDYVSVSFLTNFQTQFAKGYTNAGDSTVLSDFMAPAYWVLAAGLQYSPTKALNVFVSPITARLTFVENSMLSNEGAFGVDTGKKELTQLGAYVKANYSADIMKNVTLTTNLELFSNYLKDPQDIVVNWTTFLQFKVNKLISASINTQLIYDNNVLSPIYNDESGVNVLVGKGPRTQFKDVFGIGLAYNL
ncbi:MAG TPA: DUF3078 domain-containing protein [Bacteroidia bacterium]|nr:DUF3078 domain-containing protein [Bacteroidia bacterium]